MKKIILLLMLILPMKTFAADSAVQCLPENLFTELDKKINPAVVSISIGINFRAQYPRGYTRDPSRGGIRCDFPVADTKP